MHASTLAMHICKVFNNGSNLRGLASHKLIQRHMAVSVLSPAFSIRESALASNTDFSPALLQCLLTCARFSKQYLSLQIIHLRFFAYHYRTRSYSKKSHIKEHLRRAVSLLPLHLFLSQLVRRIIYLG